MKHSKTVYLLLCDKKLSKSLKSRLLEKDKAQQLI